MNIAVGLSGGVDSSVAALLLKEQGHHVVGLFMQNWHNTEGTLHGYCEWEEERMIAEMVAKKLDIPFHFVDLSETYRQRVVDYMFAEYGRGRTPNPDVLCNREIKFDAFMQYALDLGVDAVATGHYVRSEPVADGRVRLLAGVDPHKDQSYFLCQLSQAQLSKAVFPVGHLHKSQVRQRAAEAALPSAKKKDSQGICFVGKVDLPLFLQQQLAVKEGPVVEIFRSYYDSPYKRLELFDGVDAPAGLIERAAPYGYRLDSGKKIGVHQGAHFYTIGQRKGLGIGGHVKPLFVVDTDVRENIVYVGEGQEHLGLLRSALFIAASDIHWVAPEWALQVGEQGSFEVRIRYRQPLQKAMLYRVPQGLFIDFEQPQRGITPGQFAAWYRGEELIGSGVIF
ncbi:MAG: tRNA 2-thiouridine(34) synthase MnmA [Bacteroidales bacterium]|nr:tRNA 2-thiouridine(34) synthase MnmA [Bacteroidales bacterium]